MKSRCLTRKRRYNAVKSVQPLVSGSIEKLLRKYYYDLVIT